MKHLPIPIIRLGGGTHLPRGSEDATPESKSS